MGSTSSSTSAGTSQLANLRDSGTFTTFRTSPPENDISLDYYAQKPGSYTYTPTRHWALLAEIEESVNLFRLRLLVKDCEGRSFPINFHLDANDNTRPLFRFIGPNDPEQSIGAYEVGSTVLVVYPHIHGFMDLTRGIRQEEECGITVLPYSLQALLELNDTLQAQVPDVNNTRSCHGCDTKQLTSELMRCARCGLLWYCDKACQTRGWSEKGPKQHCKMLKDVTIKELFIRDWSRFEDYWRLPWTTAEARGSCLQGTHTGMMIG